jgi:predicted ATPase
VAAGGLGKTTLATYLYHRLSPQPRFKHQAFVELKGAGDTERCLKAALKGLGQDVLGASSAVHLAYQLKQCVRDKSVLYVLDNVEAAEQLSALLPTVWGEGSVVLVTSRSTQFIGAPPMVTIT